MKIDKKKQIIIGVAAAGLVVLLIFLAVSSIMSGANNDGDVIYSTEEVVMGDIEVAVETNGQLEASWGGGLTVPGERDYTGATESVSYVISELYIEEGDAITEGQIVAELSASSLQTSLETKNTELDGLLEELSTMTGLPKSEVEGLNPAVGVIITAPIDGRITELAVKEGEELESGKLVGNIINDEDFTVKATILPAELPGFYAGAPVKLKFPLFEGFIDGEVTEINENPIPIEVRTGDEAELTSLVYGHVAYIKAKNPGLIQKDMEVLVGSLMADGSPDMAYYMGTVDKFQEEEKIFNRATAIVSEVYAYNYQELKAGDPIIALSGEAMQETLTEKLQKIRELRSEITELSQKLAQTNIISPVTGIVSYVGVKKGDTVYEGDWIGDTYNTEDMMLMTQVDDIDVINVAIDAPVTVTVDAVPGQVFNGTVMNISARGDSGESGGLSKYRVDIRMEGGEGLRPGMQATARIDSGSASNVMIIPIEALFTENGEQLVEVLENGAPKIVKVEAGLMNSRSAEIISGLEVGDLVVTGSSADVLPTESLTTDQQNFLPEQTPEPELEE